MQLSEIRYKYPDADVLTLDEFCDLVEEGAINHNDGLGYFFDGQQQTDVSVWNDSLTPDDVVNYEYVLWYNK